MPPNLNGGSLCRPRFVVPQKYNIVLLMLTLIVGAAYVYKAVEPYTWGWTNNWSWTSNRDSADVEQDKQPTSHVQDENTGLR